MYQLTSHSPDQIILRDTLLTYISGDRDIYLRANEVYRVLWEIPDAISWDEMTSILRYQGKE